MKKTQINYLRISDIVYHDTVDDLEIRRKFAWEITPHILSFFDRSIDWMYEDAIRDQFKIEDTINDE